LFDIKFNLIYVIIEAKFCGFIYGIVKRENNMEYLIFTDASADYNAEMAKENGLVCIPMGYSLGDDMRTSEGNVDAETIKAFYDGQRGGDLTQTTQISPFMYVDFLTPYFEKGYSVLYLSLSSGLSSTFQSANVAKEELKEKFPNQDFYPVDSLAATGGMGVLLERAVRNKKNGMSLEDNYKDISDAAHRIKHVFMVQDLMYLKRGGRVSAATAVVGTALNVKPILIIDENGKLVTIAKKRGEKAGMAALIEYFEENNADLNEHIYLTDGDAKDFSNSIKEKLLEAHPEALVNQESLSPIIGAHTGPNMISICFLSK